MAPSIDEFQDLTQFADESFDTDEVDLFEFADDEDSPLLRLKSIVLSLDWDITEDILSELNEELASLRAMWKDDKVAQIYLQGMENVGKYLREEGAYAHPNAIKLLLTLYHNYEKIISSPNISGETITTMLKADIRKFKVLQYQISSLKNAQGGHEHAEAEHHEQAAAPPPALEAKKKPKAGSAAQQQAAAPAASAKKKKKETTEPLSPLRSMEATILGLEWEVTDEGLEKFSSEAAALRSHLSGNTEAQVLIQGLQALGAYIREQKTNAHPDSFTILHSFYDSLKMLLESPELGAEQRRQILIEQISSLNSLKEVIARSAAEAAEEEDEEQIEEQPEIDDELDGEAADGASPAVPAAAGIVDDDDLDIDALFDDKDSSSQPQQKSKEPPAPAAKAKPAALAPPAAKPAADDEDDEFDDDLFSSGAGGVTPALADEDDEGGFSEQFTSAGVGAERAAELDEKLNSFFDFDDAEKPPEKAVTESFTLPPDPQSLSAALNDAEDEEEDEEDVDASFFDFEDEEEAAKQQPAAQKPPLAEILEETEKDEPEEDDDDEVDSSFFDFDEEENGTEAADLSFDKQKESEKKKISLADSSDDDDDFGDFFSSDESSETKITAAPSPALADEEDEPSSSSLADEDGFGDEGGLDSFFSFDEDGAQEKKQSTPVKAKAAALKSEPEPEEDDEGLSLDAGLFGGDEEDDAVAPSPALADEEDDDDDFGDFFSSDESSETKITAAPSPALADEEDEPSAAALADEEGFGDEGGLDSFFSFDEDGAQEKKQSTPVKAKAAALKSEPEPEEDDEGLSLDAGLFGGDEEDDAVAPSPALADEEDEPSAAALADEEGFGDEGGLDSFFSFDEDGAQEKKQPAPVMKAKAAALKSEPEPEEDDEGLSLDAGLFGGDEEEDAVAPSPALADEEEEPSSSLADEEGFGDEGGLDSFFSFDEDGAQEKKQSAPEPAADEQAEIDVARAAEIRSKLDSLFHFDADEAVEPDKSFTAKEEPQELEDEFITSLDDDGESHSAEEEDDFFSFQKDTAEQEEEVAAAAPEEPAAAAEETDAVEESFFVFDSGNDDAAEPVEDEDGAEDGQDEPFGLAEEDTPASKAAGGGETESFFGLDSGGTTDSAAAVEEEDSGSAPLEAAAEDDFFAFYSDAENAQEDRLAVLEVQADEENASADRLIGNADEEFVLGEEYETDDSQTADRADTLLGQDNISDPFFSMTDDGASGQPEEKSAATETLASLAALTAALATAARPSGHALRQISALAAAARQEGAVQPQQSIVLELLEASAAMLAKAPQTTDCAIVQNLSSCLADADEPTVLAAAVSRYTAWQRQFFEQLISSGSASAARKEESQPDRHNMAKIRQELHDELFQQLRQELLAELSQRSQ